MWFKPRITFPCSFLFLIIQYCSKSTVKKCVIPFFSSGSTQNKWWGLRMSNIHSSLLKWVKASNLVYYLEQHRIATIKGNSSKMWWESSTWASQCKLVVIIPDVVVASLPLVRRIFDNNRQSKGLCIVWSPESQNLFHKDPKSLIRIPYAPETQYACLLWSVQSMSCFKVEFLLSISYKSPLEIFDSGINFLAHIDWEGICLHCVAWERLNSGFNQCAPTNKW